MAKTHVIGGVTYKEVVRKAEVGEKIVIYGVEGAIYAIAGVVTKNGEHVNGFAPEVYRVLEPIDPPQTTPTGDLLEITANLTRRVHELERENKRLRDDVTETLGTITDLLRKRDRRIEEINDKAEMLIDDVALLDERTEGLR